MKPKRSPAQIGYYPGYSTLEQQAFWDAATRETVLKRLESPGPLRFFSPAEAERLQAVCDRILPQDDRPKDCRIHIVPGIDQRLAEGRGPGYRYAKMPPDPDAYRMGLRGIEEISLQLYTRPFLDLGNRERDAVLFTLHDANPPAAVSVFQRMPVHHFWLMLVNDVVEIYYAHPWAWDEIGFGGPAYPRGYMRLENGQPEPWERPERRYAWSVPDDSLSGEFRPLGGKSRR
ncbi:MAG: gluconate 2-dehydrogenase subunit 3 family protein [Terriglobales bacterium]